MKRVRRHKRPAAGAGQHRVIKARYKIALLVGGSVMLAMLLTLLIFNIGTRRMIGTGAAQAIEAAMNEDYEDLQATTYQAEVFGVPDGTNQKEESFWLTQTERNLIGYYQTHDIEENKVLQVRIGSKSYYFAAFGRAQWERGDHSPEDGAEEAWQGDAHDREEETDLSDGRKEDDGASGRGDSEDDANFEDPSVLIAYVDITGEPEMITRLSLYILTAAIVIAVCGSILGFLIGKRMEENDASKQHFFENTSHELKTPLAVIRGYAEGIERGVITDYRKTGKVIASQSEKMSDLVEDILLMSKMEGGSEPLHKETVDLSDLVQDCLMPLEGMVGGRGLKVRLNLEHVNIQADPDRMEHAVTNLLVNAVKYAKSQIRIDLDGSRLRIWNDCERMSKEDIHHIFERFYTGSNGNTGIGLALAKEIVEKHGFRIAADSNGDDLEITVSFIS